MTHDPANHKNRNLLCTTFNRRTINNGTANANTKSGKKMVLTDPKEIAMDSKGKTIPELFKGKTILLTGATGFVGKVLLEKLLRSCPGISEVLVIIRGNSSAERTKKHAKFLKHKVFDRLRQECPDALKKVHSIDGNIALENFGIEAEVLKTVCEEVSFVFHCAANVRFDCNPRVTLTINLAGVKYLLELCEKMPKLEAVVHVSTAYSFCNQPVISEEIYPERLGPYRILDALEWMKQGQLDHFSTHVMKDRPSLYHASKALAEILISKRRGDLPIVIVRPSIVTAAVKEPFPGWIDNYNGPSGFIALSCKGILKTLLVDEDVNADWVPVDIVANTLIVAAHRMALKRKFQDSTLQHAVSDVPIINCVCPESNLITWSNIVDISIPILFKYPSAEVYRVPGGVVTSSRAVHAMCKYLYHYLPAFILDFICICLWRNYGLVQTYTRIHTVLNHLQLYTTQKFVFTSRNMQLLCREMSAEDRREFSIDQSFDWSQYMEDYVHGVRQYFLKEKDESLPAARRRVKILQVLNKVIIVIPAVTGLYILTKYVIKPNSSTIKGATNKLLFGYCSQVLTKVPFV